jgi:hypothetical protein
LLGKYKTIKDMMITEAMAVKMKRPQQQHSIGVAASRRLKEERYERKSEE